MKCEYCNIRDAKYKMTSGKWCCESFYTKCPAIKKKTKNLGKNNGRYGKFISKKHKSILSNIHSGKILSVETKEKMSITKKEMYLNGQIPTSFKKGMISWNKGIKMPHLEGDNNPSKRPEVRKKISNKLKLNNPSKDKRPDVIEKIRSKAKLRYLDKVWLKKYKKSCNIKPNKPEIQLISILSNIDSDFKYVGDFNIWIGGKNPDFINLKTKKIIEFFGDYWHSKKFTGLDCKDHEIDKIKHYNKYNYDTLVIWEYELLDLDLITNKINTFINKRGLLC